MHRLFLRSRVLDERDRVLHARNSQRHVQLRFDINIRSYFSAWKRVRPTRLPTEVGSRRICSGFPVGVDSSMELGRPDWLLGQSSRSCVFESDTLDTCPSPPLSGMLYGCRLHGQLEWLSHAVNALYRRSHGGHGIQILTFLECWRRSLWSILE